MRIKQGDHVFFCGATGSGKTTLAEYLLRSQKYVFAIDTKGQLDWHDFVRFRDVKEALESGEQRIIYVPPPTFVKPQYDALFWALYRMGGWTVYVDECYGLIYGGGFPLGLNAILTRGRELGLSGWIGAQRPRFIPRFALSEATHLFVFRLSHRDDRKAIADVTTADVRDRILRNFDFLYMNQRNGKLTAFAPLNLKERGVSDGDRQREPSHSP